MLKKSQKSNSLELNNIQRKVALAIKAPLKTTDDLLVFLMGWWCRRYNKPYKSPELLEYTFEELLFEYFDINYRENPKKLSEILAGSSTATDEAEDEEWLRKMMGEKYISKTEQEKKLESQRDIIERLSESDGNEEEFSYEFGEYR